MLKRSVPSLAPRNASFCLGAEHCTRFVCLSLRCLSVAFMSSCFSRLGSLNYRPSHISAYSENHTRFLASPSCSCRSVPPSQFSPKGTELTLESVEGKKPGSIRTSPALLAFSLSAGIPLFPAGREAVNDRIVCCRKETSHVQASPFLRTSADYLELLLPDLQGWAFSDVAPYGGGIAQEKVK